MNEENEFGQILGYSVDGWSARAKPHNQKMQGQYCYLEPLDINAHAVELYDAFQFNNLGETWTYLPFGPFNTLDEFNKWLHDASLSKMYFTIFAEGHQLPQGFASYHDIDTVHGVIEVGSIHYSKLLQKSRAGTEAMFLMMQHVFDDLGYRRYQWRCNALNPNSRAAALRLGFKFEGIFRQSNVFKEPNRDTAWYSIIDSEWPELKAKFLRWLDVSNFDESGEQILRL